jgi:hypothetical protein
VVAMLQLHDTFCNVRDNGATCVFIVPVRPAVNMEDVSEC